MQYRYQFAHVFLKMSRVNIPELEQVQRFSEAESSGVPKAFDGLDGHVPRRVSGVTGVGWEPDALTAHVRICERANSIVHGSNIGTPPWKQMANRENKPHPKHKRVRSTHREPCSLGWFASLIDL